MLTRDHLNNIETLISKSSYIRYYIDSYVVNKLKKLDIIEANSFLELQLERLYVMKKWYFYRLLKELLFVGIEVPEKYLGKKDTQKNDDKEKLLEVINESKLKGKKVLFTGALENFKRREIKEVIENMGGIPVSSVCKDLDYLIVGNKPGSKLKKAKALGTVNLIDENEFIELINGGLNETRKDKATEDEVVSLENNGIENEVNEEQIIIPDMEGAYLYLEKNQKIWHEKEELMKKFNLNKEELTEIQFRDYFIGDLGIFYWDNFDLSLKEEISLVNDFESIQKINYEEFKEKYKEIIEKNRELINIDRCREFVSALIGERG